MLNQIILVGRLAQSMEVKETDTKKKYTHLYLAVPRSFKNMQGTYDTDFFDCTLWDNIAKTAAEHCKVGDVIGVKGRLQTTKYEDKDGNKRTAIDIIAEKVSFLSSKKEQTD